MTDTRTCSSSFLIFTSLLFLFACREPVTGPTNPKNAGSTDSPTSSVTDSGSIVVRLVSINEDETRMEWYDTDSTRTSYIVERSDQDSSHYIVLAELGPWIKEYSDGGVKQILHPYYYRVSAVNRSTERTQSKPAQLYLNPRRPLSVRPIHISSDSLMLQWNFTGNISAGFLVQRSMNGIEYSDLGTSPREQLDFTDKELDTTRVYYYRAFTLTQYTMGPSSVPLKVGFVFNPMYRMNQWMTIP